MNQFKIPNKGSFTISIGGFKEQEESFVGQEGPKNNSSPNKDEFDENNDLVEKDMSSERKSLRRFSVSEDPGLFLVSKVKKVSIQSIFELISSVT